ncbi:MAG: SIS domain-containing protein [Dehalococcoidia bacterium]
MTIDVASYLRDDAEALRQIGAQQDVVLRLVDALDAGAGAGRWAFVVGNGGSSSTASHAVADLVKGTAVPGRPALRALCLSDSTPLLTAWGNDRAYSAVFAEQVRAYGRPGDVLVAISCSGNSPNVLQAVRAAHEVGVTTFGLCGWSGGDLRGLVEHPLVIDVPLIQQIEDAHLAVMHLVSVLLHQRFEASGLGAK